MKPGPKPKAKPKLTKQEKKITCQYMSGLKRSISRLDDPNFEFYSPKLTDKRLLKLLLCIAHDRKFHITKFIEDLLISQLRRNPSYREYFDNDMECEIQTKSTLRIYQTPRMATLDIRRNPAVRE